MSNVIIGVDEVGFGSIAGPLVVGAVAFLSTTRRPVIKHYPFENVKQNKKECKVTPLKDSKKLSYSMLLRFKELIMDRALGIQLFSQSPRHIDLHGVEVARREAMHAVIMRLLEQLNYRYQQNTEGIDLRQYKVIIDGDVDLGHCRFAYQALPHADDTVWQVSAAAVIAKCVQVKAMQKLHERNTRYGWDKNKGYPTKQHLEALDQHGVSMFHRKSYKPVAQRLIANVSDKP